MKRSNFIRKKEDFICGNCGTEVTGNGYTNHCPNCLYSCHVDLEVPGDRLSPCKSLMQPIDYFTKNNQLYIVHKCLSCGKIISNKSSESDSIDELVKIK